MLGDHLRLHANTNLQSLHIRILDLVSAHMLWIPAILSDIAILGGPDLQKITFDIWLWTKTQLHNEIWENMQQILNSESYSSLKEVKFTQRGHVEDVTGGLRYELARWFLQSRFPELHARHILCVEDGKDYASESVFLLLWSCSLIYVNQLEHSSSPGACWNSPESRPQTPLADIRTHIVLLIN